MVAVEDAWLPKPHHCFRCFDSATRVVLLRQAMHGVCVFRTDTEVCDCFTLSNHQACMQSETLAKPARRRTSSMTPAS